ncbi:cytochrome P450 [Diaporthe eres]|nr:cytochrome P450 [Diaporthe eres]
MDRVMNGAFSSTGHSSARLLAGSNVPTSLLQNSRWREPTPPHLPSQAGSPSLALVERDVWIHSSRSLGVIGTIFALHLIPNRWRRKLSPRLTLAIGSPPDLVSAALPGCFDTVDAGMKKEKMKETLEQQKVVGISSLTFRRGNWKSGVTNVKLLYSVHHARNRAIRNTHSYLIIFYFANALRRSRHILSYTSPNMASTTEVLLQQAVQLLPALAIVVSLCLSYVLGKALYNVFFHPLRKFPGPKTWAASRIPYNLAQIGGKPHKQLLDLHNKYGPIVRIADNELSFILPEAWKDRNGHRSGGRLENMKEPLAILGNEHNLFGANLEDHSRMRRVLSHGFSMQAVLDQQPLISTHVNLLLQRLRERCEGGARPVDMVSWYNRVTFDIISDLSWGEPLGCLEKEQDHPWIVALGHTVKFQIDFALAAANVEKRIALDDSRPDFMEAMIRQKGSREIQKHEMVSNAFLLMLGGSETSSTALSAATYFLTSHPEALSKLTHEVLSTFQTEEEINVNTVQNLPYMLAVLDETLRLNPPLPHTTPRVVHKGGDTFCGYFLPEGTVVGIPQWAMYHSSQNFNIPDSFIPERWLGDPRFASDQREGRKPFGFGPRNCIGMNLAYTEMRIILARIIWNFEMRLADENVREVVEVKGRSVNGGSTFVMIANLRVLLSPLVVRRIETVLTSNGNEGTRSNQTGPQRVLRTISPTALTRIIS